MACALPPEEISQKLAICSYKSCKKPITKSKVLCLKCKLPYHRGCFPRVKNSENSDHVCVIDSECEMPEEQSTEIEILRRENKLLHSMIHETQGKNKALELNVTLLMDKVHALEVRLRNNQQLQNSEVMQQVDQERPITYSQIAKQVKATTTKDIQIRHTPTENDTEQDHEKISKSQKNPITNQMLRYALEEQKTIAKMNQIANAENPIQTKITNNLPNNDKFKEVTYRKKLHSQRKYQTGTAKTENNEDEEFKSSKGEKKLWIFLKKVNDSVTESTIKNYVKHKTNGNENEVTVQSVKNKTKFKKNCFLVGIKTEFKDLIYKNAFWPEGIEFSRFDFRRGQHFLDNPREKIQLVG